MQHYSIVLISYNYNNAPVAFRDKIAVDNADVLKFIDAAEKNNPHINEVAVISTCNRTEFYFVTSEHSNLYQWLVEQYLAIKGIDITNDAPDAMILFNKDAVMHMMSVSGGLESMMLGENQILTQVKSSYDLLLSSDNQFPVLDRLFRETIRAGKSIRTNTDLCKGAVSISLAAVELSRKIFSDFSKHKVLLVGAGETSDLVALHFKEMGVNQFLIANRGLERRQALCEKYNAKSLSLEEIPEALTKVDIVVTATKSPNYLITYDKMAAAMKKHNFSSPLIIDISTPRNVDPKIAEIPQVFLYNIDDLNYIIEDNLEKRRKEIPAAREIITRLSDEFLTWFKTLGVVPTISKLHGYFNHIREQELRKFVNKTTDKEYEHLEQLARGIIRKLLHYPISNLKESNNGDSADIAKIDAVWKLFQLHQFQEEKE